MSITGTPSISGCPTASTPHEKSNTGTRPSRFQLLERTYERTAPVQKHANKYPTKSLYKHNPCPQLHLDAEDAACVSDSSSGSERSYRQVQNMRSRDIVKTWLLSDPCSPILGGPQHRDTPLRPPHIIVTRAISKISTASSQASPVSDVFTNSSLSDDLVSDISSMMGSCILDDKPLSKCLQDETEQGRGCEEQRQRTHRDVPTQAKLEAGLYTSVPLTPANLQRYMGSYEKRPKRQPSRPKPSEPLEPKSGWVRMLESTRKMEREAAAKMEQERRNGSEFAKWRAAVMPWM